MKTNQNLKQITAVLLVGGLGTRLRPLVSNKPKVLADVSGRPFLSYLLDQLVAFGLKEVILCTGYLGKQIESTFGNSYRDLSLIYSNELLPLGTGGALRLALPHIKSNTALVMNGDSFCDSNLSEYWIWHNTKSAKISLLLAKVSDTSRFGQVRVHPSGLVIQFQEKGNRTEVGWINAGVYLITRSMIKTIPAKIAISLEREVFSAWVDQGFYGYKSQGHFLDIGTPDSYLQATRFFAFKRKKAA